MQKKYISLLLTIVIIFQCFLVNAERDRVGNKRLPINKNISHKPQYIEGEYVIKYKDSTSNYKKTNIHRKENIRLIERLDETNVDLVKLKDEYSLDRKIKKIERNPEIEYIEPNYLYYPFEVEKEPMFGELWGLENTGQKIPQGVLGVEGIEGIPNIDIDALSAWQHTMGKGEVVVAIIDTGIDSAHPDLKDNIWTNPDEIVNGEDNDGNGYIDDIHGWDFLNDDNTVFDYKDGDYHGTHVAGTIAATFNGIGIVGVAPKVKIMPLKFLGTNDYGETVGSLSDVLKAIEYAKDKGVKIVNASWGNYEHSQILEDAIANSGMLFIAASGNENINTDQIPSYPANFNLPNIISIGAIDNEGNYADFSNYGIETVHVAAPGVDILSTIPLTRYGSAAIFNKTDTYKAIYQGFGLEILDKPQDKENIIKKAMDILEVNQEDSILIVQDDESDNFQYPNCLEHYKEPLEALGFENIEVHNVKRHENGPDFYKLRNFHLVLWFTGEGFGTFGGSITTITQEDQQNLMEYLDYGGKLYLSGRDAGEGIEKTQFYTEYLNSKFISQIGSIDEKEGLHKNMILGQEGTIFEQEGYMATDTYLSDIIMPYNDSGRVIMVYGKGDIYHNSYMYSGGTSMATPHVSGMAALLYSLGEEDLLSIKSLIMRGIRPIDGMENKVLTGGLVNVANSINKYLDGETIYIQGIDLGEDTLVLDTKIQDEYIFEPAITPLDANDKRIRWLSSDESVAIVDEEGRVIAIGEGVATITAITLDGGFKDRCEVMVKDYNYPVKITEIKTFNINGEETTHFKEGEKIKIGVEIKGNVNQPATIILQLKDSQGRPCQLIYDDIELLGNEGEYIEFEVNSKDNSSQKIEVYIWGDLNNMKPLSVKGIKYIN